MLMLIFINEMLCCDLPKTEMMQKTCYIVLRLVYFVG